MLFSGISRRLSTNLHFWVHKSGASTFMRDPIYPRLCLFSHRTFHAPFTVMHQ